MVTNLPPQAKALMREYQEATSLSDRIEKLEALISAIPEHKGTEKLRRQLKKTLARLRTEFEERRRRKSRSSRVRFTVRKDGAGQIILLGDTMSGKSSLLSVLTNAKPKIGHSPCTTKIPVPGMMIYNGVQVQLVEAPPIFPNAPWLSQVLSLCRNADALVFVVDLSRDPVSQLKFLVKSLRDVKIILKKPKARIEIERRSAGGVHVFCSGALVDCDVNDVIELLKNYGVNNGIVRIWGDASLRDVENYVGLNLTYKPSLVIGTKVDLGVAEDRLKILSNALKDVVPVIPFSALDPGDLSHVKARLYGLLNVITIYTKEVGGDVARKPMVVPLGTRVIDVAKMIHSRLHREFKYARVWGPSVRFDGQRVGGEHILLNGDVVEIRTK